MTSQSYALKVISDAIDQRREALSIQQTELQDAENHIVTVKANCERLSAAISSLEAAQKMLKNGT